MGTVQSSNSDPFILIDPTQHAQIIGQTEYYKIYRNNSSGVQYEKYEISKSKTQQKQLTTSSNNYLYSQNKPEQLTSQEKNNKDHHSRSSTYQNNNTSSFQQLYQYRLANRQKYFVQLLFAASKETQFDCNFSQSIFIVVTERIVYRFNDLYNLSFENGLSILNIGLKGFQNLFIYNGLFWIKDNMLGINQQNEIKVWLNSNYSKNTIQQLPERLLRLTAQEKEDLIVNNFIDMVSSKTRPSIQWMELMRVRMEMVVSSNQQCKQRGVSSVISQQSTHKKMTFSMAIGMVQRIMRSYGLEDMIDDNKVYDLFDEGKNKRMRKKQHAQQSSKSDELIKINSLQLQNTRCNNSNDNYIMRENSNAHNLNNHHIITEGRRSQFRQIRQSITSNTAHSNTINAHHYHNRYNHQSSAAIINHRQPTYPIHHPLNTTKRINNLQSIQSYPMAINQHNNSQQFNPTHNNNDNQHYFNSNDNNEPLLHKVQHIPNQKKANTLVILNQSRSISNDNNRLSSKSPVIKFSHSTDKPIIVNHIKNNKRQSFKVNFVNNSIMQHQQTHYPRQSIRNFNNRQSIYSQQQCINSQIKYQSPYIKEFHYHHQNQQPYYQRRSINSTQRQQPHYHKRQTVSVQNTIHQQQQQIQCGNKNNNQKQYNTNKISGNIKWRRQLRESELIFDNSPVKYRKISHVPLKNNQLLENKKTGLIQLIKQQHSEKQSHQMNKQQFPEQKQFNKLQVKISSNNKEKNKKIVNLQTSIQQHIQQQRQREKYQSQANNNNNISSDSNSNNEREITKSNKNQNESESESELLATGSVQQLQQLKLLQNISQQQQHKDNNNNDNKQIINKQQQQDAQNYDQSGQNLNKHIMIYTCNNNSNNNNYNDNDKTQHKDEYKESQDDYNDFDPQPIMRVTINHCNTPSSSNYSSNSNIKLPSVQIENQISKLKQYPQQYQQQQNLNQNIYSSKSYINQSSNSKQQQNDEAMFKNSQLSSDGYKFNIKQANNIFESLPLQVSCGSQQTSNKLIQASNKLIKTSDKGQKFNIGKIQVNNNTLPQLNINQLPQIIKNQQVYQDYQSNKVYEKNQLQEQNKQKQFQIQMPKSQQIINKLNKWENRFQINQHQLNNNYIINNLNKHPGQKQQPIRSLLQHNSTLKYSTSIQINPILTSKPHIPPPNQQFQTIITQPNTTNNTITYKHLRNLLKSSTTNYSTSPQSIC